jgi:hypothetical protein
MDSHEGVAVLGGGKRVVLFLAEWKAVATVIGGPVPGRALLISQWRPLADCEDTGVGKWQQNESQRLGQQVRGSKVKI